ncbi:MAG: hypothetical protein M0Q92_07010 [Methanoregula sp.]|jgi:hypothetical protein|nr:hypothetical protein [Methanoregula sp.]
MNTGKIMIGFSLVLLSIAMMVTPSGAAGMQDPGETGCGITLLLDDTAYTTGTHPGPIVPVTSNLPRTNATYPYE